MGDVISPENSSGAERLLSEDHHDLDLLLSAVCDTLDVRQPEEVLARLDLFWARLAMHIRAENIRLLPALADAFANHLRADYITAEERSKIDEALAQLRSDHDFFMRELANGVNSLREVISTAAGNVNIKLDELERMLTEVRERLIRHNQLEEDVVYRLPARLLDETKQSSLEKGINQELANLPPRFRSHPHE